MGHLATHRRRLTSSTNWPKAPKLTSQEVLNLISRTDNIDELSRVEYESIIEYYSNNKIPSIIGSNDFSKISIILRYMFSSAENIINIFFKGTNEIIDDSKVLESLDYAIEKNIKINIILSSFPYNSQTGEFIINKLKNKDNIKFHILNKEIDNKKNIIIVIDSFMYYEQNNSSNPVGICNFYSPSKTSILEKEFEDILNLSALVQ